MPDSREHVRRVALDLHTAAAAVALLPAPEFTIDKCLVHFQPGRHSATRRGSNTVHGELFEFNRNSALSADNFFSAYNGGSFQAFVSYMEAAGNGDPLSDPTLARLYNDRRPPLNQNQFGGNLGGALKRDKVFGFFNWESSRLSNPRPIFQGVPGTYWRTSNPFSPCAGSSPTDPNSARLFSLYPSPNVPNTSFSDPIDAPEGCSSPPTDDAFFVGESTNFTHSDNFLERIDLLKSERANLSFRHNIQQIHQIQGGTVPASPNYPSNGIEVRGRNQNFSLNYTQQFTHASNEFRLGWNRFQFETLALDRTIDPASLGFTNLNFHNQGLPTVFIDNGTPLGVYGDLGTDLSVPSTRADDVWSFADDLGYTIGRHNWKFGEEYHYIRLDVLNEAFGRGLVSSGSPANSFSESGKFTFASIARVAPDFGGGFDRSFRSRSFAGFAQDQWHRSNFTLNYGLRYEVNTAPIEARNRLVNFYPNILGPGAGGLMRAGTRVVLDEFGNDLGMAPHAVPRAGFSTDLNNWGPRFGFAWSPGRTKKIVVRGAYALMFDHEPFEASVNMLLNPPYVMQDFSLLPQFTNTFSACAPAVSEGPACLSQSPGTYTSWFRQPYSITGRDPNSRTPFVHQWNFGIQRQLGRNGLYEVAYIGSAGHKLPRLRDISPCTPALLFQSVNDANPPLGAPVQTTGACSATVYQYTFDPANFRFPPLFSEILNQEDSANSNFHSLLLRFQTRASRGLQFGAHYQFAKSIDDASSLQPQVSLLSPLEAVLVTNDYATAHAGAVAAINSSPTLSLQSGLPIITTRPALPQDSGNPGGERGLSDFDVRHRFVLNLIYAVPQRDPLRALGKGWQLAGISTLQSGQPYSVFLNFNGIPLRPDLRSNPVINYRNPQAAIGNGVPLTLYDQNYNLISNPASPFDVTPNLSLQPGNLGRNTFTGPGLLNTDFAILKNTDIGAGGRKSVQFRVEFFNAFNRSNVLQPDTLAGDLQTEAGFFCTSACSQWSARTVLTANTFFGQVLQARPARQVQFALRFIF